MKKYHMIIENGGVWEIVGEDVDSLLRNRIIYLCDEPDHDEGNPDEVVYHVNPDFAHFMRYS